MNEKEFILIISKMLKKGIDIIEIKYNNDNYTIINKGKTVTLFHNGKRKNFRKWKTLKKELENSYGTPGNLGGLGGAYVQPSFF